MTNPRTAILLLNHFHCRELELLYTDLLQAENQETDLWLLTDSTYSSPLQWRKFKPVREHKFTVNDLEDLGYPKRNNVRVSDTGLRSFHFGLSDLPVVQFYNANPHYSWYWVVEYDVRFSGQWRALFDAFSDSKSDLLATTLTRYEDCRDWAHWHTLQGSTSLPDVLHWVRGFFPTCRFSKKALITLHTEYKKGAAGHQECIIPTTLLASGLVVEDMGGSGEFVRSDNHNRFYCNTPGNADLAPGSFVYRPIKHVVGAQADYLWHPVKPHIGLMARVIRKLNRILSN